MNNLPETVNSLSETADKVVNTFGSFFNEIVQKAIPALASVGLVAIITIGFISFSPLPWYGSIIMGICITTIVFAITWYIWQVFRIDIREDKRGSLERMYEKSVNE